IFADSIWDMVRVQQDSQKQTFKAVDKGAQEIYTFQTDLLGNYQAHNIKTVLAACSVLRHKGWQLSLDQVWKGLASVKKTTGLRGRWDWIEEQPNIILDVAHNPAGMAYLLENLQSLRDSGNFN